MLDCVHHEKVKDSYSLCLDKAPLSASASGVTERGGGGIGGDPVAAFGLEVVVLFRPSMTRALSATCCDSIQRHRNLGRGFYSHPDLVVIATRSEHAWVCRVPCNHIHAAGTLVALQCLNEGTILFMPDVDSCICRM